MNLLHTFVQNFVDLNDQEKLMVLNWRNHKDVRQWMHHSNLISEEDHFSFLHSLIEDHSKKYYLVSLKDNYIGVIYFTNIDTINKKAELGIYTNPSLQGKGKMLMELLCQYGFANLKLKTLIAEVFPENHKALALYKTFNFQKTDETIIRDKTIIHMEHTYENR